MTKIAVKFLISIGFVTILYSCFLLYQTYTLTLVRVNEVVEQQAKIALKFNLSIRNYVASHIRPVMYDLIDKDEFIPETMSTSYVSRAIFEDVRKAFPEFIIKFASDNPRNPVNQAGPEELNLIRLFNENPDMQQWQGDINIDGKPYLALFSARRMRDSCLNCHGDPNDAPKTILEKYGDTAGFHRPLGEVIGLDTIAIPTARISGMFMDQFKTKIAISGLGLAFFLFSITLIIRNLMTTRLTLIANHLKNEANKTDPISLEPLVIKGNDEIGDIALGFNFLSVKLKEMYTSLESQVLERTSELKTRNEELGKEIRYRTRTQELLEQREATMEAIFRAAPTGIGVVTDRVFSQVNKTLCSMVGYTEKELLGENSLLIYPSLADYEKVGKDKYKQIDENGTGTVETIWKKKDGRNIDILLSSTPIDKEDYSAGVIFTALDITPQKNSARDKKYLEERLARSQKMEALGLLAGGVAHDLNNVLSGIVSYPDLLLMEIDANEPLHRSIKIIQDSGKKAEAIVQDLLTLARRGVPQTEILNVNSIIEVYLRSPEYQLMFNHYPELITSTHFEPKLLNIRGSSIHLKKTIMNLVNNAAEAIHSCGAITISTYNQYVDRPIKGYDEINEGDFVVVSVRDNGSGIGKEDLQHIFEPFYTKKVMGRSGTGLGMSVVWGTIQDHSGYINIDTEVGKGTTFELFFPVTREPFEIENKDIELVQYQGNNETILIVDDDKTQHVIAGEILSRIGYNVESAGSGEDAIEYLRNNTVDLVLLDMIMEPGIDGLETYRRIIEINPEQKTIIASGFSETKRLKEAQRMGAGQYVKKPYTLERIGLAIKQELSDA